MHLNAITVVVSITTVLFLHSDGELIVGLRSTESKVGETTYFNCSTNLTSKEIFWFHGEKFIFTGIFIYEPYDTRFTIERNASSGSSSVVIHSVEPGDAGEYACADDNGSGRRHYAQLVVLDNDPDCQSNIQPDGVIGQNIFSIPQDEVHLICTVTYHGNIPPQLEWTKFEDDGSIKDSVTSYISPKNRLVKYTLKLKGDISLDKSSYVCQSTKSTQNQFKCTSQVIKVLYFLDGNTTEKIVVRGNEITCIIKNNTFPCVNQWYIGNDSCPLSCDETITAHLLGEYLCMVKCHVRGTEYLSTALKAFVVETTTAAPRSQAGIIAASVLVPVVIIALIAIFVILCMKRKEAELNREQDKECRLLELELRAFEEINLNQQLKKQRRFLDQHEEERLRSLGLITTISTKAAAEKKKAIMGLTILDKELFVLHKESSEVEIYDSMKLSLGLSRRWNLDTLIAPEDIVSCDKNKCLYISDNKDDRQSRDILKVDPNGKLLREWSTKNGWGYLSVTQESNVILTAINQNKLNEYLPDGSLIREIELPSIEHFRYPNHAIKLKNGQFVVSHGDKKDDLHTVWIVDAEGKRLKYFGEKCGSNIGETNFPNYLFVDEHEFVIVADVNNHRVLLLDSDLKFKKEILNAEHGLRYPFKILLDEANDLLFVADNDSDDPRILIFNYRGLMTNAIFLLKTFQSETHHKSV